MNGDGVFDTLVQEFETQRDGSRVNQRKLDAQKTAAQPGSLALVPTSSSGAPGMRLPAVRPYSGGRLARREAEAEQKRQWEIVQTTQRTMLATTSMAVATVHAQRQLEQGAEALAECYFGRKRHEAINEFMGKVTAECLARMQAGVMSILDTHPRRLGEDL